MTTLEAIVTKFYGEDIIVIDGFDQAVIGIEEDTKKLIYSVSKCLEIIQAQGVPEDDSLEYLYENIKSSNSKDRDFIFCFDDFRDLMDE